MNKRVSHVYASVYEKRIEKNESTIVHKEHCSSSWVIFSKSDLKTSIKDYADVYCHAFCISFFGSASTICCYEASRKNDFQSNWNLSGFSFWNWFVNSIYQISRYFHHLAFLVFKTFSLFSCYIAAPIHIQSPIYWLPKEWRNKIPFYKWTCNHFVDALSPQHRPESALCLCKITDSLL